MKTLLLSLLFAPLFIGGVQFNPGWNLDRIDQRTGFDGAYSYQATGQGVRVYVVDSGIADLSEFSGRVSDGYGRSNIKCSGHGTAVGAVIGAETYGVAKDVDLVSVKIQCTASATAVEVIRSLNWIAKDLRRFSGRSVVNISLNGDFYPDLNSAVQNLIDAGAVVVAGAGNSGRDACLYSPSAVKDAIVVGGTDQNDTALIYSNFGQCVDLYAPGEGIWTIWNTGERTFTSGTSYAAPHVSGLAAIYLERHPFASVQEVRDTIVANSTPDVIQGANPNLFIYSF
jgi:subtilisin family serine protease